MLFTNKEIGYPLNEQIREVLVNTTNRQEREEALERYNIQVPKNRQLTMSTFKNLFFHRSNVTYDNGMLLTELIEIVQKKKAILDNIKA